MSTASNVSPIPRPAPQWTFADRARKVRRDMGMGQAEMAERLGVGLKAYSAWESGKNTPENIVAIAEKFEQASGVHRTWFLGWVNDPNDDGWAPSGSNRRPADYSSDASVVSLADWRKSA